MSSVVLVAAWLAAMPAQAETFWTETWDEDPTVISSSPDHWWDDSCGGDAWPVASNPGLSETRAVSGTRSLKHVFAGHQPLGGGCFVDRSYPASDEIWVTWWEWMDTGFEVDGTGTKTIKPGGSRASHWWTYMWGSRQLTFNCQACKDAAEGAWGTENYYQNLTAFSIPDNKWVCYELHLRYNTPGQADALYEGFATMDGNTVQFAGHYNREWRGTSTSDPTPVDANFTFLREYVQDGVGTLYRDDLSVGNTRRGCGEAPLPEPNQIVPVAPSELTVG